jgi:hypothetical protein
VTLVLEADREMAEQSLEGAAVIRETFVLPRRRGQYPHEFEVVKKPQLPAATKKCGETNLASHLLWLLEPERAKFLSVADH